MDAHAEEVNHTRSADQTRDPTTCAAHVQEGGVLLRTLPQHHLVVILAIFSTISCFQYLVLLTKSRRNRAKTCEVEEGGVGTQDAVRRQLYIDLARCQDWVWCIDVSFGLFLLAAFVIWQYIPQMVANHPWHEKKYVWTYLGRWHIAAFLKTLWFVVTMVTQKSHLYRVIHNISVKYFRSTERPFNIIALYMLMTSYMLLPVVIDILVYYSFPERHFRYGVCVEQQKMSPLCMVVILFYGGMIVSSGVILCMQWLKGSNVGSIVTMATRKQKDDEPALLSDDGNDVNDLTTGNDNNTSGGGNHGNNYLRNITENVDLRLPGQQPVKTVDEVVGYERNEERDQEEIKLLVKQNKRHKLRMVAMAVLEPLLLWLWVVVVLHGNAGFSPSNNVDHGNMTLLWSMIAACYALVCACVDLLTAARRERNRQTDRQTE